MSVMYHKQNGPQEYIEIKTNGPVADVIHVVSQPTEKFFPGVERAPPSIHLSQARDPRFCQIPEPVVITDFLEFYSLDVCSQRMWPRSNERHLTHEDIDQLREFVETVPSQQAAKACHPWVPWTCLLPAIIICSKRVHRAEFIHVKRNTAIAKSFLFKQHRSPAIELYCDSAEQ
jgi:hypothetical protein